MIAKVLMVIAAFIAIAPHVDSLRYRLILNSVAVAGIAGLLGTATREQPLSMMPMNMLYGALISIVVTLVLHAAMAHLFSLHHRAFR